MKEKLKNVVKPLTKSILALLLTVTGFLGNLPVSVISVNAEETELDHSHAKEDLVYHEFVAATCSKEGNYTYYECSVCGKLFDLQLNEYSEVPVIEKQPEHHTWSYGYHCNYYDSKGGEWLDKSSKSTLDLSDLARVEIWRVCENCGYITYDESTKITKVSEEYGDCLIQWQWRYQVIYEVETNNPDIPNPYTVSIAHSAPGHLYNYDSVEYEWEWDEGEETYEVTGGPYICERCGDEGSESVNAEVEIIKEATCTEDGIKKYTATFDDTNLETQTREETYSLGGHNYEDSEPTYTWSDDYSTVTGDIECSVCHEHVTETVDGHYYIETIQKGTASQPEIIEYTSDFFDFEWFNQQQVQVEKEHKHNLVHHEQIDPTCQKEGTEEYWECSDCEEKYSDAEGKNKIDEPVVIPKTDHEYREPTYSWSYDNSTVTGTRTCKYCNHKESETVKTTNSVIQEGDCETPTITEYVGIFTNPTFTKQTKTEEVENNHEWSDEITFTWSDDNNKVTATQPCNKCDEVYEETVKTTSKVVQEQDCEHPEITEYTPNTFEDGWFEEERQNKDVSKQVETKPAAGHDYDEVKYEWSDDLKTVTATQKCKNCDDEITETVETTQEVVEEGNCLTNKVVKYTANFKKFSPVSKNKEGSKTAHNLTKHEYLDSTCEKDGHIEYYTCEDCGKYFSDSEGTIIIDKEDVLITRKGHEYGEITYTWSDDNTEVTAEMECLRHDHTVKETVKTTKDVTQEADCTNKEISTITGEFENEVFETQIKKDVATKEATGHKMTKVDRVEPTTDKEGNMEHYICDNDGKYYLDEEGKKETTKEEVILDKLKAEEKKDTSEETSKVDDKKSNDVTKTVDTADESKIVIYGMLLVTACAVIIMLLQERKEEKE